jgi:glucosamine--fructose-6-phosphate aminotransferase (isomerizing)
VIGIGHTRWATMACRPRPTPIRSRPTGVAVVHNGIIENFQALRHELTALGHAFRTETDTRP